MYDDVTQLKKLGSQGTTYDLAGPSAAMLETFPNRFPGRDYRVVHQSDEFTSLCPKTGQPDFATIIITFVPDQLCVESKSLKLYLFAWRGEGSFMETIVNRMLEDLVAVTQPRWMEVLGEFNARGGVQTTVRAEHRKT